MQANILAGLQGAVGRPATENDHWYALRLRSRFEFAAREHLAREGFEAFLPTWEETVRRADRHVITTRPLFGGYIFARFDAGSAQDAILRTRGVVQILRQPHADGPESVPDEVIENLRRMAAVPNAFSPCPYVAGESVTVQCGAYAGVKGIVVRTADDTHLVVSIDFLGRSCRVKIDAADVQAASCPRPAAI